MFNFITLPLSVVLKKITGGVPDFEEGEPLTLSAKLPEVSYVRFFEDGQQIGSDVPFVELQQAMELTPLTFPVGQHKLVAVLYDANDQFISNEVYSFNINAAAITNQAPTIDITTADNFSFTDSDTALIDASALDADGTVVDIEWSIDDLVVSTPTLTSQLDVSSQTVGTHTATAVAIDDDGARSEPATITFTKNAISASKELKQYVYALSPETYFTVFPKDENGWSIINPVSDSNVVFVANDGDDATGAVYTSTDFADVYSATPTNPFATIAAAAAHVRAGYADFLLLKSGDEWDEAIDLPIGRNSTERHVLGWYGGTARPIVKNNTIKVRSYTAVLNIEAAARHRDPSSPEFVGFNNVTKTTGITPDFGGQTHSVLIEGCLAHHHHVNVSFGADRENYPGTAFDDIVVRRTVMHDAYKANESEGHPQGVWAEEGSFWLDDCVWTRNGFLWTKGYIPDQTTAVELSGTVTAITVNETLPAHTPATGYVNIGDDEIEYTSWSGSTYSGINHTFSEAVAAGTTLINNKSLRATVFSHNNYFSHASNTFFTDPILDDGCSIALKFTSNQDDAILQSDLTAVDVTVIPVDSIFADVPQSGTVGIRLPDETVREVPYQSRTATQYNINATDFSGSHVLSGAAVRANAIRSSNVHVVNPIITRGEVGISMGGNIKGPDEGNYASNYAMPRWSQCYVRAAILESLGSTHNTGRDLGWGIGFEDQQSSEITETVFLDSVSAVTNRNSIVVGGFRDSSVSVYNNLSRHSDISLPDDISHHANAGSTDIVDGEFVTSSASILDYAAQFGATTWEQYADKLKEKNRDNWNDSFTAQQIQDYIRQPLALTNDIVAYSQPSSTSYLVGVDIDLFFGVFANTRLSYQWVLGDNNVAGQTTAHFSGTAAVEDNGKSLKCVVTDEYGNTLESTPVTLSISATPANKIINPDDLTQAEWTKSSTSTTLVTDPDTGETVSQIKSKLNRIGRIQSVEQYGIAVTGQAEALQFKIKSPDGLLLAGFEIDTDNGSSTGTARANINLQTQTVDYSNRFNSITLTDAGDGWLLVETILDGSAIRSNNYIKFMMLGESGGASDATSTLQALWVKDAQLIDGDQQVLAG